MMPQKWVYNLNTDRTTKDHLLAMVAPGENLGQDHHWI